MITIDHIKTAIGANTVRDLTRLLSPVDTEITDELEEATAAPFIEAAEAEVKSWFDRGIVEWDDDADNAALNLHIARIAGHIWMCSVNDGREIPSFAASVSFIKEVAFGRRSIAELTTIEGIPYAE